MERIAKFEKISFEQFERDWIKTFEPHYYDNDMPSIYYEHIREEIEKAYNDIKLPKRATVGSAGYDFYMPMSIVISDKKNNLISFPNNFTIPTGIRVKINEGWVLKMYPRSSHGFKYGIHLANTVGIIDSDYYNSDNEGHIFIKLINDSLISDAINLGKGTAFCQGVFVPYGITTDDIVVENRNGGIGSTNKYTNSSF